MLSLSSQTVETIAFDLANGRVRQLSHRRCEGPRLSFGFLQDATDVRMFVKHGIEQEEIAVLLQISRVRESILQPPLSGKLGHTPEDDRVILVFRIDQLLMIFPQPVPHFVVFDSSSTQIISKLKFDMIVRIEMD
ncbi:hypothetical protein WI38_08115 [Burkholderia ubonensis]|uniref:Uncharacterized protein n=1 Tax=Burkholderia ubonensis TaxID=101571 RepID=A0A124LCT3_9BURK|nr:hypothetical protein WI38_08115 [Burkholderia ubonensis]KUZ97741.1 hypothetical protein WI39_00175 [Burkholderia ubonensis]